MNTTSTQSLPPLEAARKLAPQIRALADEIERQRELPTELTEAIADSALLRMLMPRSLGGNELDPPTYIRVIEEIARADGSTGWCVNQGSVFATNTAFLAPEVGRLIWGASPRSTVANGPSPTAEAIPVNGGYRVTGEWTFSSGCRHATWLAGFATIMENGQPRRHTDGSPAARYMLFPKEQAEIIDVWQVSGLRGTGSHNFAVRDLFVPSERTVWSYADPLRESSPLYLYPMVLLFACGFASVAIGVARTALDTVIELAGGKKPRGDHDPLRYQGTVQMQIGRAESIWRSARALLHETVREVWEEVSTNRAITLEQRIDLRMATTHAIRLAAEVVDIAYNTSGTTAIYTQHPLQRCFQDIHVITQHIQGRIAHYESIGQFALGLEPSEQWL